MQFCGPKVASALARAVDDPADRAALLAEGQEMLNAGLRRTQSSLFYRDAIEAALSAGDGAGAPYLCQRTGRLYTCRASSLV